MTLRELLNQILDEGYLLNAIKENKAPELDCEIKVASASFAEVVECDIKHIEILLSQDKQINLWFSMDE